MALGTKLKLLNAVQAGLENDLTMAQIKLVVTVLQNELVNYEVEPVTTDYMGSDDLLRAYIDALRVEGRSPKTLHRYEYEITKLMKAVKVPTQKITVFDIRNFMAAEKARGISGTTLEGNRQIYNGYFNWLRNEQIIKANPVANIGSIKSRKKINQIFSEVDIEKMKNACQTTGESAIVSFLLSTGCRVSEVIALNKDNVNLESLEVKVVGKGDKERIVYIDSVTAMFLTNYFNERTDNDEALFRGKQGRYSVTGIEAMLNRIEKRSGVYHVHPHKFRRTLATNLLKHGMPIEEVAAILGHDKLDTTMRYIVLDHSDIEHSYRKYA